MDLHRFFYQVFAIYHQIYELADQERDDRIAKGDTNVLFEDSEENRKSRETSAYIGRFVETCETTLDQLTKKKLIIKQLISTKERGNTAVFYPREWGEDAFHQWSP